MEQVIRAMKMVQNDCEEDAKNLDGRPFDGRNVAEVFGATLAMVATVARAVELLAEEKMREGV